ncbi:hypothetical protein [Pseudomonas sp. ABFPK]|uniref:hypothetical protein n=1 Tax=Pseudomonas sp. ABFPK TaxID=1636605 RepID=UPI0015A73760|nr:hypothetical protein [Pseudomonas sp. ABFPK]
MSTEAGIVAFIILAAMTVTLCVSFYISIYHLDRIESLLPNSAFVSGNKKTFSQAGLIGKVMRTLSISILLTVPKIYARKSLVDLDEVTNFPIRMKRTLIVLGAMHPTLIGALILFRIWLRPLGPIP